MDSYTFSIILTVAKNRNSLTSSPEINNQSQFESCFQHGHQRAAKAHDRPVETWTWLLHHQFSLFSSCFFLTLCSKKQVFAHIYSFKQPNSSFLFRETSHMLHKVLGLKRSSHTNRADKISHEDLLQANNTINSIYKLWNIPLYGFHGTVVQSWTIRNPFCSRASRYPTAKMCRFLKLHSEK